MSGIKGQKSGGYGGRHKIVPEKKRNTSMTFRVTETEKQRIKNAKKNKSLTDFILELIENFNKE
ncbi:type II toxin-antitoxin system TacA family antitoxin [Cetobacterium somerae]